MNRTMKRYFTLLFISILIISTVTACAGKASDEPDNTVTQEESAEKNEVTFEDISGDIRGNKAPTQEQIDEVNGTLNDTYLGDVFDEVIPSDYSAYPVKGDVVLDVWMPANPTSRI